MDTIYSLSLLVSLVSGALSALLASRSLRPALAARLPRPFRLATGRRRLARGAIVVAFAALLVSLGVHLVWGHRPGTPAELPVLAFFRIHPAYLAAAALPLGSALWLRSRREG